MVKTIVVTALDTGDRRIKMSISILGLSSSGGKILKKSMDLLFG
jgi:hypothetical protein